MLLKDVRFWLIMLATALLMLVNLGKRDFWDPDEPRYAQVAREMVERGDWLLMHINGRLYPDKPPMYFWTVALISKATGSFDEFSTRLFPAVSGIIVVLLTMLLSDRMFGRRTAILAGIGLATSYVMMLQSRWVHMDMPLAAVMMLMFYVMYRGAFEVRTPRLWLWFFVFGALGIYIKGPVGLLVPIFAGFVYLVLKQVPNLPNPKRWVGALAVCAFAGTVIPAVGPLICLAPGVMILFKTKCVAPLRMRWFGVGFALCILTLLPWLIPMLVHAENEVPGAAKEILVRQNLGRFIKFLSREETGEAQTEMAKKISHDIPHQQPFYYYYYAFPMLLLPWAILLPWACAPIFRRGALSPPEWRKRLFLMSLVIGVVLFFSLSSSKRELYSIPAIPITAILVARLFEDLIDRERRGASTVKAAKAVMMTFGGIMGLFSLVFLIAIIVPQPLMKAFHKKEEVLSGINAALAYSVPLAVLCILMLAGAVACLWSSVKAHWAAAFAATAALTLLVGGAAEFLVMPDIVDQFKSARPYAEASFAIIGGGQYAWYGEAREGVLWYSHRQIPEIIDENGKDGDYDELAAYLNSGSGTKYILTTRKRWDEFQKNNAIKHYTEVVLYERFADKVGEKTLILLSTTPSE